MSLQKTLAVTKSLAIHLTVALLLILNSKKDLPVKPRLLASGFFIDQPQASRGNSLQKPPRMPKRGKKISKPVGKPTALAPSNNFTGEVAAIRGQGANDEAQGMTIHRASPVFIDNGHHVSYPEKARLMMLEGIVHLRLTISEQGRVIKAEVLSGHAELIKAALKLAAKLAFLPATDILGSPRIALVEHEVVFRLRQNS